jgi:magnesium-protoporphyrin IX monomethyl ester (oxidative) cyclase
MAETSFTSKADVCLVQMPYGPVELPSMGLSILKAALNNADISATIFYANFLWAEEIGAQFCYYVSRSARYDLAAEWTFSGVAFPDFEPDHNKYFDSIQLSLGDIEPFLQQFGSKESTQEMFWRFRRLAPAFVDRVAEAILKLQPRIVGCSSAFQQHCSSLALLKKIKELNPNVVTMMGGSHCEVSMGVVTHKNCHWVDFVVSGEADMLLPSVCKQILATDSDLRNLLDLPEGVLGPCHRRYSHGKVVGYDAQVAQFPPRARITDMKNSPTPDYDDYFTALQTSAIGEMIIPGLPIETSRGCWWGEVSHCTFCGLNDDNMSYRSKEQDRVIEELKYLSQRYQIKDFLVVDNILDMQYFQKVIPTLAEQQQNYNFYCEVKTNLKREHLQKMADAGIRWITPGIESLDNTILKQIGKGCTVHQNLQLMKWAREMGIFNLWVMVYDIPGEDDEAYLRVVKWLPKISHFQPPFRMTFFGYYRFSPAQTQPARFKLNISPHRSYYYVYPWDEQDIEDFAYYFYDYTIGREQIDMFGDTDLLRRPGLRALGDFVKSWQQQWMSEGQPPTLVMVDDGEQIEITDTRLCAIQPKFYLSGLSRQIYHICDKARKSEGILKTLQSEYDINCTWNAVEPSVQELCENGLLLEVEDGYFLSLAVPGPLKPLPTLANFPGGSVVSPYHAKMIKWFKQSAFKEVSANEVSENILSR